MIKPKDSYKDRIFSTNVVGWDEVKNIGLLEDGTKDFKLDFGTVAGLTRLLDVGQCNDAYSAVRIATALADAFNTDVNSLTLIIVLSWYEQKSVADLLALLSLGIRWMYLGPTFNVAFR